MDREDTVNKNPETEVPGEKMIKNFILNHAVLKAFGQSTLNLHTCQPIKILRREKEVPITENLLISECGSPLPPGGRFGERRQKEYEKIHNE